MTIQEFGAAVPGQSYVLRRGAYSIILRRGKIAVILTPGGIYLPGGGQRDGESPEQAAVREAREECGLHIRLRGPVGVADELVYAAEEKIYFRKRCTFFTADAAEAADTRGIEPDHQLIWLAAPEAISRLSHESQKWAVRVSQDM